MFNKPLLNGQTNWFLDEIMAAKLFSKTSRTQYKHLIFKQKMKTKQNKIQKHLSPLVSPQTTPLEKKWWHELIYTSKINTVNAGKNGPFYKEKWV